VLVGAAHAPTQTPHMLPQVPGTGPVPVQVGPSGPHHVIPGSSSSGLYPGYSGVPIKKSNTGLIIAIIAVVVVGGGIAAFAVVSGGKKDDGPGSGSMVALADAGAGGDPDEPPPADAMAALPDAEAPVTPDAEVVATIDAAAEPPDAGTSIVIPDTVEILIKSRYHTSFEVWEGGRKLFDGPDNLPVAAGESRKITIKARGYKDKSYTVSSKAKDRKFEFRLVPIQGPGPGSGSAKPPPDPGCRHIVADPTSEACRKQYCQFHKNDDRCNME
jgi:hypothetical protein